MKNKNDILDVNSVAQQLTRFIEINQQNSELSNFQKFDGEAISPLMHLMFAARDLFKDHSPAELVDILMELMDCYFFRNSNTTEDSDEGASVTINRIDGANALFNTKQLIMLICKSFTALQDFKVATGIV